MKAMKIETMQLSKVMSRARRTGLCVALLSGAALVPNTALAENGGVLWKKHAAEMAKKEEPKEPSLVPVVLSAMAGSVLGIELAVVGIGVAAGSTMNWWVLGSAGAAAGAVSGAWAGDYFFNPKAPAGEPAGAKN